MRPSGGANRNNRLPPVVRAADVSVQVCDESVDSLRNWFGEALRVEWRSLGKELEKRHDALLNEYMEQHAELYRSTASLPSAFLCEPGEEEIMS